MKTSKEDEYEIPDDSEPKKEPIEESELDQDYRFTRLTYYRLIESGFEALDRMKDLVEGSDHPRAYEVYGGLMGKISEINGQLLDMQRKRQVLKGPKDLIHTEIVPPEKRIVFSGTATDIQKDLKRERLIDEAAAAEAALAKEVAVEEIQSGDEVVESIDDSQS